jgi:hypothetical protein
MHWSLAHMVGDYLLQNDWMALNKKRRTIPALVHVLVYLLPFLLCSLSWWQIALIGAQHFVQDRTSFINWLMRVKGSGQFATGPCAPWSIIVTDNVVHIVFIAFVVWLPAGMKLW